ncbi:palmitoyl-monogalactosyldiacylglycerol delta-7 desaturase, chloroplastic-like [Argentina anserina]|uniref:palmitoyl-monogalactosyldiacylglycerol delta-7 desaturase, chloroplastic-like n=1 Tax=Argentina anserina TaxID=57926 RepID=UPI0021767A37|nr:palmitoyl-monogalactosyldiacylglycerol delta-7 desaturase, chloroplastic-like [Potentilla anserina]
MEAASTTKLFMILAIHGLALLGPFYFNWSAFWLAVALYFVTGVGITLSFHRNLAHRSFELPRWLEYSFAYCAVLSFQGSPIEWVSTHRLHHQYTDTCNDPHTPIKGFWYSHIGWIVDYHSRFRRPDARKFKNVGDLKNQWYYRFLHYTYPFHSIALGSLLYTAGGLPFVVWGMGVRTVIFLHVTFSINSICHIWGKRVWNTGDSSKNNWLLGLLAHGEGWHNNHHAFEYSARQGLEWWEIDTTWYIVSFLEAIGLATDVKLPTETDKKQKAFPTEAHKILKRKAFFTID